jgi:membrane-associated phospholipid phosphatase
MPSEPKIDGENGAARPLTSNVRACFARIARPSRSTANIVWARWTLRRVIVGAALTLIALVLVAVWFDVWAITEVRRLPASVITGFDEFTDFGKSGWFLFPLAFFLLGVAAVSPMLSRIGALVLASIAVRAGFLFCAIAVPGLFTLLTKYVIGRARPYVTGVADAYAFSPLMWQVEYASLPSGHASAAFSAAAAIGSIWPHGRIVMWTYAMGIAVSRVVVTSHYPSDVIASAVVGVVGALVVRNYCAARGLGFGIDVDGKVHAFAGPSFLRMKKISGVTDRRFVNSR